MGVRILTDSTSYINHKTLEELSIKVVSLNVKFQDESFKETDIDNTSFYKMMEIKGIPISSQPAVGELHAIMKELVKNGDSLLCIFLSSDMSGTFATAHIAKQMVLEDISDAEIEIIDSRSNCMQLGFAVIEAAKTAILGKSLREVKEAAEKNILRSRFLFIPDNLVYLKKGGRIGGASALIGNFLKIIPILTVEDGKTAVLAKIRTKKKAIMTMVDKMFEDVDKYGFGDVVIHHINCTQEAREIADFVGKKLNRIIGICDIGPVIGLHVGPGAIGIAYYTEKNIR